MRNANCVANFFKKGEMYDDLGSTYEDGTKEHYFVHAECDKKAMEDYRHNKWKQKFFTTDLQGLSINEFIEKHKQRE